jgi:ATP-dependent Clp protease adapter protein ClpS
MYITHFHAPVQFETITCLVSPLHDLGNSPSELIEAETAHTGTGASGYRVILYNDDWHSMDEVVLQVQKATACDLETAVRIVLEVHANGRGVCYRGGADDCHRVARVLREIRLQCEVDDDK